MFLVFLDPLPYLVNTHVVKLCHHWAFACAIDTHKHTHTDLILIAVLENVPLFCRNKEDREQIPSTLGSLTSEPRRTQTGEVAQSVLAGGAVPARLRGTLVHVNLAVGALETRHAEARVAVPACSADGAVLAGVRRALVLCGGRPVIDHEGMDALWTHCEQKQSHTHKKQNVNVNIFCGTFSA